MSAGYTIQQYLLDRANIQDTVNKITLYYDTHNAEALADECYVPGDVTIDYTSMFGGQPLIVSNRKWAADTMDALRIFDAKQHVLTGIVIDQLPQPAVVAGATTTHAAVPDQCMVVANVNGHLMRKAAAAAAAPFEAAAGGAGCMAHNGVSSRFATIQLSFRQIREKRCLTSFACQGRYELELVRIKELEEAGKNPWRVRRHKCILTWSDGNDLVMEPLNDAPIVTRE
ncbi:hypothetical protein PGQ11_012467 [Apiospora arundinis]|uniref:SnoaL-like domain-containing protein n=1 Tax=Apiospora arundinis TaxID=335852 RepID=A0ABR2I3F2_9PEZI